MGMRDLLKFPSRHTAGDPELPRFMRVGASLLNQQCWCWGCDIRRSKGNLLLAFGFERQRPPEGIDASSCYRITLPSGHEVALWGFGVLITDGVSALYLARFDFEPQLCSASAIARGCWSPTDLAPLRPPTSPRELTLTAEMGAELLDFIGAYESWIAEMVGLRYRERTVHQFKQASYTAMEAKLLWSRLAKQIARHHRRQAHDSRILREGSYHCA